MKPGRPRGRSRGDQDCPACEEAARLLGTSDWPVATGPVRGTLRVVDLFAGCGGMTLGLWLAAARSGLRLDVRLALDTDPRAAEVYLHNFGPMMDQEARVGFRRDVMTVLDGKLEAPPTENEKQLAERVGRVDVLVGGPPCQGHSDLNNHTRRRDPRNQLYLRMARAVEVLKPGLLVIENVPAVLRARSPVVSRVINVLKAIDYRVEHSIVNLLDFGVPQSRKRHVLVAAPVAGSKPNLSRTRFRRRCCRARTVSWAIRDLLAAQDTTDFDTPAPKTDENRRRIAWLFEHGQYDLHDSQRPPCHQGADHTYKSIYGRLRWERPAQTLTTGFTSMGQGRNVHPGRRRTLTPHEGARLQGFPDFFDFTAGESLQLRTVWARLIGNAVPPQLVFELARSACKAALASSSPPRTRRVASC